MRRILASLHDEAQRRLDLQPALFVAEGFAFGILIGLALCLAAL